MEIELPIPMPTWNRILAMQHFERMKLRHLIHHFISLAIAGWPDVSDYDGKARDTSFLVLEYMQLIRPNKKRKAQLKELRNAMPSMRKRKAS
jgi:hypothetical protein